MATLAGPDDHDLLVVLGPTACGKTRLGVALARALGGEIVSADSRQVYRGLDIGTGKDLAEYGSGAERVAHHLIDVVAPDEQYSLYHFQRACYAVFESLWARGRLPLLVGGSGLYIEAVIEGYALVAAPPDPALRAELKALDFDQLVERLRASRPQLHNTTDLTDRRKLERAIEIAERAQQTPPPPRPQLRPLLLGTAFARETIYARIGQRLAQRLDEGLIEEVERLRAEGLSWQRLDELGLEYQHVAAYLRGHYASREALHAGLWQAIRHFARRQLSWFRRMERRGWSIHWIPEADPQAALEVLRRHGRFGPWVRRGGVHPRP
jgi:tRNA dimethylallyltransferase